MKNPIYRHAAAMALLLALSPSVKAAVPDLTATGVIANDQTLRHLQPRPHRATRLDL
jgi:hypothetical protein